MLVPELVGAIVGILICVDPMGSFHVFGYIPARQLVNFRGTLVALTDVVMVVYCYDMYKVTASLFSLSSLITSSSLYYSLLQLSLLVSHHCFSLLPCPLSSRITSFCMLGVQEESGNAGAHSCCSYIQVATSAYCVIRRAHDRRGSSDVIHVVAWQGWEVHFYCFDIDFEHIIIIL